MFKPSTTALGALALAGFLTHAQAADVAEGTVISAANIDQIKSQTFAGKPLSDLILPTQEKMIREFGLQMRLRKTEAMQVDPKLVAATKENAGKASIGADKKLEGFVTGMPFASIDAANPADGAKLAEEILAVARAACGTPGTPGACWPDLTVIFDVDEATAQGRLSPLLDRMEGKGREFHAKVRRGYLEQAARDPAWYAVVDARGAEDDVARTLIGVLRDRLCGSGARAAR